MRQKGGAFAHANHHDHDGQTHCDDHDGCTYNYDGIAITDPHYAHEAR